MDIKVVNTPEELKALPLKQSIYLECSEPVELEFLKGNITLVREVQETGLLNLDELYNRSIGYIKDVFDYVDLDISTYEEDGKYMVKCDPIGTLRPNSTYILYIDENISNGVVNIEKTVSKGPGRLIVKSAENLRVGMTYKLKVVSSPNITSHSNKIKFELFAEETPIRYYTVDAKSSNPTIEIENILLEVQDSAFGLGDTFILSVNSNAADLSTSVILPIVTALSEDIAVLENVNPSHKVTNADVIAHYESMDNSNTKYEHVGDFSVDFSDPTWMEGEMSIEYLDDDIFMLRLNKLNADELDLDSMSYRSFPAFNKYDLKSLSLYDPEEEYTLGYEIIDQKQILFTATIREERLI